MGNPEPIALLDSPARQFTQERARRSFESLVDAARELFAERGFDATQTPDIARAAGVSVGTFYNYFSDKKAIYLEVVRRDLTEAYRVTLGGLTPERFVGKERRRAIEDTLAILLDHVTASPRLHRVLLEMSLRDDDVAALRRAFDREAQRRLTELVAAICCRATVPDPEATAYVIHTAVVECAGHMAMMPASIPAAPAGGSVPVSRERALAALSALIYRALFGLDE